MLTMNVPRSERKGYYGFKQVVALGWTSSKGLKVLSGLARVPDGGWAEHTEGMLWY